MKADFEHVEKTIVDMIDEETLLHASAALAALQSVIGVCRALAGVDTDKRLADDAARDEQRVRLSKTLAKRRVVFARLVKDSKL